MQRFTFRLEHLLRVRKKTEEKAQQEFSVRQGQLLRLENQMKQVRATLSRYVRSVPSYQGRTFTAMEAVAMDNYILRLNRTLKELDEVRARKAVEVDRFRQVLIEARKARKVIEVLKERQWNRYLEDFRREEQLLLDDVTRNMGVNENRLTLEEPRLEERGFGGSELEEPVPQVRDGEEFSLEEM